jgi:hypothetical protein
LDPGNSIVTVSEICLIFGFGLVDGFGFEMLATFTGGEQIDLIQRSAASADLGILEIWPGLGQTRMSLAGTGLAEGLALAGIFTVWVIV